MAFDCVYIVVSSRKLDPGEGEGEGSFGTRVKLMCMLDYKLLVCPFI